MKSTWLLLFFILLFFGCKAPKGTLPLKKFLGEKHGGLWLKQDKTFIFRGGTKGDLTTYCGTGTYDIEHDSLRLTFIEPTNKGRPSCKIIPTTSTQDTIKITYHLQDSLSGKSINLHILEVRNNADELIIQESRLKKQSEFSLSKNEFPIILTVNPDWGYGKKTITLKGGFSYQLAYSFHLVDDRFNKHYIGEMAFKIHRNKIGKRYVRQYLSYEIMRRIKKSKPLMSTIKK